MLMSATQAQRARWGKLVELKTAAGADEHVTAAAAAKHGEAKQARGTAMHARETQGTHGKAAAAALTAVLRECNVLLLP